ncbi:hypothetical protein R6Q57_009171 [Mikania cordata]
MCLIIRFFSFNRAGQASTSSSFGQSDCDIKPCGRPGHIARHCLHRPTKFFYGKNQKVTPNAKHPNRPMRTDQSSKPRVKPQKMTRNHSTTKRAKQTKKN